MRFYLALQSIGHPRSYAGKLLGVCFVALQMPLLVVVGFLYHRGCLSPALLTAVIGASLIGVGAAGTAVWALLAPVRAAAEAMQLYLTEQRLPMLPTQIDDEAGLLMAGVQDGITRLDGALDAARARFEATNRECRGTFGLLSSMSHELRTPLNHIIGFAEMMATEALGPLGTPEYKEYASDIRSSGIQLLDVLQNVLDLSRVSAGIDAGAALDLPVADAVHDVVALVHLAAERKGVAIRLSIPAATQVHVEPRALKQMLLHGLATMIDSAEVGGIVRLTAFTRAGISFIEIEHAGQAWSPNDVPPLLHDTIPGLADVHAINANASASPRAVRLALVNSLAIASGGSLSLRAAEDGGRVLKIGLSAMSGVRLAAAAAA